MPVACGRISFSARTPPAPNQLAAPNPINYNGVIAATLDGIFYTNSRVRISGITDGTSNTIMFGERQHKDPVFDQMYTNFPILGWSGWAWVDQGNAVGDYLVGACRPINWFIPVGSTGANSSSNTWVRQKLSSMSSAHSGGANVALCDGSVRFLRDSTSMPVLWAMATRAGGEVVSDNSRVESFTKRVRAGEQSPARIVESSNFVYRFGSSLKRASADAALTSGDASAEHCRK